MLIKCPECNHEISDKCDKCIHCGYPIIDNNRILSDEVCPLCKNNLHVANGIEDKCSVCGYVFNAEECREKDTHWSMVHPSTSNTPKCPICQSTNLTKISSTSKAVKIATFGLLGAGDVGKTWKCNNCGSKF